MSSSSITIPETKRDAKLRVTAYYRLDLDKKVISFQPGGHEKHRIRPIISPSFSKTHLSADLGPLLKHLPPEILVKIFLNLDIASIFTARQTNGALRAFVTSIPEYHVLSTRALDAYLAIHRTNLGPVAHPASGPPRPDQQVVHHVRCIRRLPLPTHGNTVLPQVHLRQAHDFRCSV
ncbi:hypothetical protein GE09DRAFT_1063584 [Coniochaeta sp. 2T2.1]|nr:hypothetical protein GE09DRAFT_1063584 [Coniochaeta sp. 2T2.1]